MASSFGWLDTDDVQRQRMRDVIDLFREQDTVDEIGIGSLRDTLSDILFPGTSTLHTRLRYVFFIPWLVERAVSASTNSEGAKKELRRLEIRLINSLLNGEEELTVSESRGIIGQEARDKLKRLPSEVYWAALGRWGIHTGNGSLDSYLRTATGRKLLAAQSPEPENPEDSLVFNTSGFNLGGIGPPDDLLQNATMDLTVAEADLMKERFLVSTHGSLLAWLVENPDRVTPESARPWDLDLSGAPLENQRAVAHAQRFHTISHGASLLYNLLLTQDLNMDERVEELRQRLDTWRAELDETQTLTSWNKHGFWSLIASRNPRLSPRTRAFIDTWIQHLSRVNTIEDDTAAREFITRREHQIKGSRARLRNKTALEMWGGSSGLGRLEYRWSYARRLLLDLHAPYSAKVGQDAA